MPPVGIVGSKDCIASGDDPLSLPTPVVLLQGYDLRCWTQSAVALPPLQPVLWYRPDELNTSVGQVINSWQDASDYRRDEQVLLQQLGPLTTIKQPFTSGPAGSFDAGLTTFFPNTLTLAGDFAIFFAGTLHFSGLIATPAFFLTSLVPPLAYPLGIHSVYLVYTGPSGQVVQPIVSIDGDPTVTVCYRRGNKVWFRQAIYNFGPFTFSNADTFRSQVALPIPPQSIGQGSRVDVYEYRVYDGTLTDDQIVAIQSAIQARYLIV